MVDIFVIMNNDIDSLINTLGSISFQNYKDYKVIIVNGTDLDVSKKLDLFNNLNIKIVNCGNNCNLKNYGLDNSNSKYLLFINSGDLLYNCFSLSNIMANSEKYDLITGKIAISYEDKVDYYSDINRYTYGKLYNRDFIKRNMIRFIDTKHYSDMVFNKMYLMCLPKTMLCSNNFYFTSNIMEDDNNIDYLVDYCKSFEECIRRSIELKYDKRMISKTIYSNILYLYNKYNSVDDEEYVKAIFKYGINIYNYYLKYNKYLTLKDKDKINIDYRLDINYKYTIDELFNMFTVKE